MLRRVMSDRHGGSGPTRGRATAPVVSARRATARRRRHRAVVVVVICGGLAFAGGLVIGAGHVPAERTLVERFVENWSAGDFAAMYDDLSAEAKQRFTLAQFTEAYDADRRMATATSVRPGEVVDGSDDATFAVPVVVRTRVFGTFTRTMEIEVAGSGESSRIAWGRHLAFPGLAPGDRLTRETRLPERAALLARDRTPLAKGSDRTSDVPDVTRNVVGTLGPIPAERADELRALGWPGDAKVGINGLERALDTKLAGTPGGTLRAGSTILARSEPKKARDVRTSISIPVERAAIAGLADRLGGVVAIEPRTGELLAFAGIAFSGLQPPGSTMKIVTVTAGLEQRITSLDTTYPVETFTTIEGVQLENANGELCGGTLTEVFAESCNSVFAPMGAKLGAEKLVEVSERFGFNRAPDIPGAATPRIPVAAEIGDALAVGSSAIGQGRVEATALTMGTIAATIARGGRRPRLTLEYDPRQKAAPTTKVTSSKVARTVEKLMLAVVREGTGRAAAIQGVQVAGKTGTAELETTKRCEPTEEQNPESCSTEADPTDTDAWFVSYAPVSKPRIAVGVMLVRSGAGGDTAAPVARQVMLSALRR